MDTELNLRGGFRRDAASVNYAHTSAVLKRRLEQMEETQQFPCTPAQRRLWLLNQLDPDYPALNIAVRWRLEGKVFNGNLEKAFRLIIARHQVLRTSFADTGGELVQRVVPQVAFRIPIIDLTTLPEADALHEAERTARLEVRTPFDLSTPPLLRVTHLRLAKNTSVLLVTLHRIVSDYESMRILQRDLNDICAAFHRGHPPDLPTLPISYGDFLNRQSGPDDPAQQANIDFWKRTLQGVRHFEIQPDYPRPQMLTANSNIAPLALKAELFQELTQLAHNHGSTLFTVCLTALLTLLHRYTGETDIAIGSEFSGRDADDLKNLLGLFSNTVVLRNDLSGDPDFVALLTRVRDSVAASRQHQSIAPEKLVEIVMPQRDLSRNPLFSVNFIFQPQAPVKNGCATSFTLMPLPACSAGAICDLNFMLAEGPEAWQISCEFNTDLFDQQTVARLLNQFTTLLRTVTADPWQKISRLTIIDEAERRALLVENNRTSAIYPKHLTFPQIFQTQAARAPDAIALVCGEQTLTYRELDSASNRLAHELRRRGIDPASRVAVFLDRSAELVVALVAILKSGCTYIPLDPAYPAERLGHVFENSQPAAVISRTALHARLAQSSIPAILLDADALLISEQSAESLPPAALPEDPAYIIYTSGSTGRPKGVVVPHRGLVNLIYAMRYQPGLTHEDTVVCVTTISFDIAVMDLFLPLAFGAKLVLAQEHERMDGAALFSLLKQQQATFMQATPVTWQLLLEAGWCGQPALKMLCGGEALTRKLAEKLLQCGGELWNMYGPTETTVWSSVLQVESGAGPVLIGPPIANTQFYILDSHQQLVPHGVPGELFIGGDGVALGYFDLPAMTREKFVADKFGKYAGAKLYRTGDMVRMKQGGCMEYLGRTDHQIKLRGFRIELEEIEAVVLRHPAITEAVAILAQDAAGEGAIWAYAVATPAARPEAEALSGELRANLMQSLPVYMVPAAVVMLDALPRTPNGKIDRRALPVPAPAAPKSKEPAQLLNEVERRLALIWSSILGFEAIDKHADFFEVGGHSLLAARLLARIEAEFGQRLSLLTLFKVPTIAAQAKLLMQSDQREYDFRQVVRLQPEGSKLPLIAIHNTGVYYYHMSKRLGSDQPLMALQLFDPSIARTRLPQTIEEIAAEYVQLIYQFQTAGPYQLIGWCVGGVLAFEVARQLVGAGHEVSLLAMIDSWAPGHRRRLSRLRAALADYSYRWQLIGADWRRVIDGEQTLGRFLARRTLSKKLLRWLGRGEPEEAARVPFEARDLSAENYDQWLLGYLEEAEQRYEPRIYPGKITLFCSAREPKGLFLDRQMGWGPFATEGVDVAIIDGDHFTMFEGHGLKQMALHIAQVSYGSPDRLQRRA